MKQKNRLKPKVLIWLLLSIIVAALGFTQISWHIDYVQSKGYPFTEIFNFGTWMNQNFLVIIGVLIFIELVLFFIFKPISPKQKNDMIALSKKLGDDIKNDICVSNETDDIKLF